MTRLKLYLTLKGSYVYRSTILNEHTTPSGSNKTNDYIFYKHEIPSGLNTQ